MFILGHLSDIHLAPLPRPAVYQLMSKRAIGYINWRRRRLRHRREVLDGLVDDLLAQGPDHIAMTGDLVNIALPEEFRVVRRWLDKTGGPEMITVIPGNHDAYVPFLRKSGIRHWEPYMLANDAGMKFGDHRRHAFPFVRIFGDIALLGLSSARATMPGMASGRLGREQMLRTAALLERLGGEGYCRVVLIHHPPLPGMTDWYRGLHDARAFRTVLSDHGAELVIHGHNHRVMLTRLEGRSGVIPIIGAPSASVASIEPSKRAGYNLFSIDGGGKAPWRISMKSRSFDPDGRPAEINQDLLP